MPRHRVCESVSYPFVFFLCVLFLCVISKRCENNATGKSIFQFISNKRSSEETNTPTHIHIYIYICSSVSTKSPFHLRQVPRKIWYHVASLICQTNASCNMLSSKRNYNGSIKRYISIYIDTHSHNLHQTAQSKMNHIIVWSCSMMALFKTLLSFLNLYVLFRFPSDHSSSYFGSIKTNESRTKTLYCSIHILLI